MSEKKMKKYIKSTFSQKKDTSYISEIMDKLPATYKD
jgi:hypothetical protein